MKERPIIFSSEMVKAILDGRKTQTRRLIKPQPKWIEDGGPGIGKHFLDFGWAYVFVSGHVHTWDDDGTGGENWDSNDYQNEHRYTEAFRRSKKTKKCPYGQPGDRLWVKEDFGIFFGKFIYRAGPHPKGTHGYLKGFENDGWRSCIFMSRKHSRIILEITDIRVERLQDISEEDAKKEGCFGLSGDLIHVWKGRSSSPDPRAHFCALWDSIHKKDGFEWDKNRWVWVISFKRITP